MMTFKQAPHRAMLSYATIRTDENRVDMKQELNRIEQMFYTCVCGAVVTLAGGVILGACIVAMMR